MQLSQIQVDAIQERKRGTKQERRRKIFLNAFLTDIDLYAAEKNL